MIRLAHSGNFRCGVDSLTTGELVISSCVLSLSLGSIHSPSEHHTLLQFVCLRERRAAYRGMVFVLHGGLSARRLTLQSPEMGGNGGTPIPRAASIRQLAR